MCVALFIICFDHGQAFAWPLFWRLPVCKQRTTANWENYSIFIRSNYVVRSNYDCLCNSFLRCVNHSVISCTQTREHKEIMKKIIIRLCDWLTSRCTCDRCVCVCSVGGLSCGIENSRGTRDATAKISINFNQVKFKAFTLQLHNGRAQRVSPPHTVNIVDQARYQLHVARHIFLTQISLNIICRFRCAQFYLVFMYFDWTIGRWTMCYECDYMAN